MESNFKYLTHNPDDKKWGLYLMVAGSARIMPNTNYPPRGHPTGYNFHWSNGRILQEYQLNYITEGEGIMETRKSRYNIKAGSIILLHPNVWHRYKPVRETGWFEHYIGFRGEMADNLIKSSDVLRDLNVIQIGFHENILRDFNEIIAEALNEKPGYHQVCSGLVIHILGQIISIQKNKSFRFTPLESNIQRACIMMRGKLTDNINIEEIANELQADYSQFRKAFKKYTGLSPKQYHMSLRLKQASYILTNTDLSVKEISSKLGFSTQSYFSKLFKEKMKKTPSRYRIGNGGISR
ncbi:MAG: AraC family transcriptional regulator [Bacteroidales bacterium]|nr:AraC family transcriptional regulator [Bacteroidales bacterium]